MYGFRQAARMAATYVNAVYYPSWAVYKEKPPSSLDVANITHIFYAFMGYAVN